MLNLNEIFGFDKIKYKDPLIITYNSSSRRKETDKNIANNNMKKYCINSVKQKNYYKNNNCINKNLSIAFEQNKDIKNIDLNLNNNSISNENNLDLYSLYINSEQSQNLCNKKTSNSLKKKYKDNGDNLIINNSVNNHIHNFLYKNRYINHSGNKSCEPEKQYFKNIISDNQGKDIKIKKLKKENIFEVMKELKLVNDKKYINDNLFTERSKKINNIENSRSEELLKDSNMFSPIQKKFRAKNEIENYYNTINDNNDKNRDIFKLNDNEIKKNLYNSNIKKINIMKNKEIDSYNSINDFYLKQNYMNPFILSTMNQSEEDMNSIYKMTINSKNVNKNENKNINRINITKYNYDTCKNKNKYKLKYQGLNSPVFKKVKINNIKNYNHLALDKSLENNFTLLNNKQHSIEKINSIYFKGINITMPNIQKKKFFHRLTPSIKKEGRFTIYKENSNKINNNLSKNIFSNSNFHNVFNMNYNTLNNTSNINNSRRENNCEDKSDFKNEKFNLKTNKNYSEAFKKNLNFEINNNGIKYNNINDINNNLIYDNIYRYNNIKKFIYKNKTINKSLNTNKSEDLISFNNINNTYNYSDKKYSPIKIRNFRKIESKNQIKNNLYNKIYDIENNSSKKNRINIINYNFNDKRKYTKKLTKVFHKVNNSLNKVKLIKKKEDINLQKSFKKLNPNFKVPNVEQIIEKAKKIAADKKFKTQKDLFPKNQKNILNEDKSKKSIKINKMDYQNNNSNKTNDNLNNNKNNNITPDLNDSDFIDFNRLDLEIRNSNIIYRKLNKYNNPQYTANDIINLYKNKEMNLESNDTEPSNLYESFSNYTFKNDITIKNNKNKEKANENKDLDLSNLNSLFNSRFQYNNERKSKIINTSNKPDYLRKNISNYFAIQNSSMNSNNNNDNEFKKKLKIKIKKLKKSITNEKKKKSKSKEMYKDNSMDIINKQKEEKNKKRKKSKKDKKELSISTKDYQLEETQEIHSKKNSSIKYGKNNNNDIPHIPINEFKNNEKIDNNNNNYSLCTKRLVNRTIVPSLYINIYKSRNINNNKLINSILENDKFYKLSESESRRNYNNNYNNYISNYPEINNHQRLNTYIYSKNYSPQNFYSEFNSLKLKLNNKKNRSFNYNNYYLNKKKIENKFEEEANSNKRKKIKNNKKEEDITQEESEESEENYEENEIKSPSWDDKANIYNKNSNKEKYLLELKENGLPDLPKNRILSCNKGSLINISIYNGLPISSNVSLITDSFQMFPSADFVENLINESKNNFRKSHLTNEYFENKVNSYQKYPSIINTKIFFQIICERAGNITFMFMYKDENDNDKIKFTEPFHILVNPLIELNNSFSVSNRNTNENNCNNNIIELTQIKMQTVISKNIGKLKSDFKKYFEEASLLGYNFIHFKTLQSLSSSENLYSIKDHNELNNSFFNEKKNNGKKPLSIQKKNELFKNFIKKLKRKYNLRTITDVILTQASTESEWILTHTECAYNLENTPWLNAAYKLDEILINYSNMFYNKKVLCSCAPYINNIQDLEETMKELGNEVYKNNLEEYFMIPINEYIDKFHIFYKNYLENQDKDDYIIKKNLLLNEIKKDYSLRESNYKNINNENNNHEFLMNESIIYEIISQSCKNYGYKRYGVEMPVELISLLIIEKFRIKSKKNELINDFQFLKEIKNYINLINKEWLDKSKEMISISLLNIKEFIRYQFIQLNRTGIKRQLIDSYFHVIDKNDPKKILLCNGWIMQSEDSSNYYPDITAYGTWYYFKRKVIIWKDTIKINYGENISKTPEYLLNYMTKYITYLSNIFEGLYIESLSNLPMFILKYFIFKARQVNPNIIFMTQLPTVDDQTNEENNDLQKNLEKKYTEELGINLFVHEIIWDCSNIELIKNILSNVNSSTNIIEGKIISKFNTNLYSMSKTTDNKIFFGCYKYLKYHKPFCILYDLTQDNQSYYEKYNILSIQKAMISSIGLLDCAIGSTRGCDQLFLYQVNSQKEQRLYYFHNNKIKNMIKNIISIKGNELSNNKQYQEVIFELHKSNIILSEKKYSNKNIYLDDINNVKLSLSFHKWEPDIIMEKINNDLFIAKIKLPIGKHNYKYLIDDNLWICDSSKPIETDENYNMNNILDLSNINTISMTDISLLRCYLNSIREKYYNKTSEIFIQKNNDLLCIIRMITDSKSLINNSIDDNIIEDYKNNLKYNNYILNNKNMNNFENINIDNNKNINDNNLSYKKLINHELNPYEGYAIITRPTYNIIENTEGKGEIIIPGKIDSVICSFSSNKEGDFDINTILEKNYLIGVNAKIYFNKENNYLNQISTVNYYNNKTIILFHSFPVNSILILKFSLEKNIISCIENLNKSIEILFNKGDKFVEKFELSDINKILFKTEKEEREWSSQKRGTYELNMITNENIKKNKDNINKIKFIYSGLHQIMDIIKRIKRNERQNILFNDNINNEKIISIMDEKIFIQSLYFDIAERDNLIDYFIDRINNINSFSLMNDFIKNNIIQKYKKLPCHIKTIFFESIIISLYQNIIRMSLLNIPFPILNFGDFATALSLCRYEFFGQINSSSSYIHDILIRHKNKIFHNISISRGIPYNTIGTDRMFFRDTLIAFKSLFLISNSFSEGKNLLKIIASCLRHGLIPDFFDEGQKPRYNSRDTCWLFINAIKNYIYYSKDYNFLKEEIELIFASDNNFNEHLQKKILGDIKTYSIEDIIHIIFQSHAKGIHFREWDYSIKSYFNNNSYLKKEGYNIDIELDPNTGFIYGGNYYNNGTWMNKLGNGEKRKTRGIPVTPRPGADIEIISLLYSNLDFVVNMGNKNYFKYKSVVLSNGMNYPYLQWKLLIKDSFEGEFFVKKINIDIAKDHNNSAWSNSQIKRNIYKDYKSKNNINIFEFQLRPNFLLALYISPELFTYSNVIKALNNVELYLLRNGNNVIGLKTLDKTDKLYNGLYENKDNSNIFTSCEFNIHNGIEHTWLYGIYLILKIKYFNNENININSKLTPDGENEEENQRIIKFVSNKLIPIMNIIKNNKWFGLPEMTDELGYIIKDGNQSDLKAMAIFFELIEILSKLYFDENDNDYSNDYIDNSIYEL